MYVCMCADIQKGGKRREEGRKEGRKEERDRVRALCYHRGSCKSRMLGRLLKCVLFLLRLLPVACSLQQAIRGPGHRSSAAF